MPPSRVMPWVIELLSDLVIALRVAAAFVVLDWGDWGQGMRTACDPNKALATCRFCLNGKLRNGVSLGGFLSRTGHQDVAAALYGDVPSLQRNRRFGKLNGIIPIDCV